MVMQFNIADSKQFRELIISNILNVFTDRMLLVNGVCYFNQILFYSFSAGNSLAAYDKLL